MTRITIVWLFTVVGEPVRFKTSRIGGIGVAVELIDLNKHSGQHPRMGAVDVVPFIPIRGCTMEEAIALSKEVGEGSGHSLCRTCLLI